MSYQLLTATETSYIVGGESDGNYVNTRCNIIMPRNSTYYALTLRVKASGESNREAWFLTAEEGILRATVFGGPKSRLRAQVSPFHSGNLLVYHDPVRDSRKVNEFDVFSYRAGLRERYERAITADAVAETILSSQGGGGSWSEALNLAAAVLDALDSAAGEAFCSRIGIYFLWYWAGILGIRPDLSVCASCAREIKRDESLLYSLSKETLLCENCMQRQKADLSAPADSGAWLRLGPGARLWLNEIVSVPPTALVRVSLDTVSQEQANVFTKAVLAGALGKRLPTWDGI